MKAREARAGGRHVAEERGAVEEPEVARAACGGVSEAAKAPLVTFLSAASIGAVLRLYEQLPAGRTAC